jgi:hypothetical protein
VILFTPLSLFAAEWSPYVAASAQFENTIQSVWAKDDPYTDTPQSFLGFGSQFEIGWTKRNCDIYVGYGLSAPDGYRSHETWLISSNSGELDGTQVNRY